MTDRPLSSVPPTPRVQLAVTVVDEAAAVEVVVVTESHLAIVNHLEVEVTLLSSGLR